MIITVSAANKIFRRKHDGMLMGDTINLGIDYSTGVAKQDVAENYEEIDNPVKLIPVEYNVEESDMPALIAQFKEWKAGEKLWADDGIHKADVRKYNDNLYQVLQSHTTQSDWTPDITPALFKKFTPPDVIAEWVQPTGSHDAYNIGDRVLFNGNTYESLIDNNVWSPLAYPAGWKLVD